eukprot:7801304-Pyramimonas_sp.AAC.1
MDDPFTCTFSFAVILANPRATAKMPKLRSMFKHSYTSKNARSETSELLGASRVKILFFRPLRKK